MERIRDFTDLDRTTAALEHLGAAAPAKAELTRRAAVRLQGLGLDAAAPALAFFVPGRIEVLGKHTDYAGGSSIVAAAELGFCLVAAPRDDDRLRIAADNGETAEFALDPELVARHGHWSNYPMTVARRLSRNFSSCRRGLDIAFCSDLPPAAGMSSSSALMIATYLALAEANSLGQTPAYRRHIEDDLQLAAYLGTIENGQNFGDLHGDKGVGTFGGSEDHTAILCSQTGSLGQFVYCPARLERRLPVGGDRIFAVGFCGVVAEKTGDAQELYNRAALRVGALVKAWNAATGEGQVYLADILRRDPQGDTLRQALKETDAAPFAADELERRLDHFLAEDRQILPAAGDALLAGDFGRFGELVDRSQALSHSLLDNQVPETIALAACAREQGALAASAFGAGFGGSVWALIDRTEAEAFVDRWRQAYAQDRAGFWLSGAGGAACRIGG